MFLSVIIPVINESGISEKLDLLMGHLKDYSYEIIMVDDSGDQMFQELKRNIHDRNDQRISLIKGAHRGKGAAVKKGILASGGDIIFYMDADFRISLENIPRFIDLIDVQGYELAVAQRPFNKRPKSLLRLFFSAALFFIVRFFIFTSTFFYDTQCGFKAFKAKVLKSIAQKQTVEGGMFDIEYLYMARYNGLKIAKVPVVPLPEIRSSKINLWRCMVYDVGDLLNIKIRGISGHYRIP